MKGENMKYLIIFIFLVIAIVAAGCVSEKNVAIVTTSPTPKPTTPPSTLSLCKNNCSGVCYDQSRQSCCYGTILDGNWKESGSGSCYNLNYVPRSQFDGEWYCGGVIMHTSDGTSCCSGKAYNSSTQGCCYNNSTQADKADTVYNSKTSHCCFSKVEPGGGYWETCGSLCYDSKTHHCCNGKIVDGGPSYLYGECGNSCYEKTSQSCCNGRLYPGEDRCCEHVVNSPICSEGMQCCNDKDKGPTCYNPKTQCCALGNFPCYR